MPSRRRFVLNPTLQLTAVAEVSRRGRGRTQVEVRDAAAVRFLLAAVTGTSTRTPLSSDLRQHLIADGLLVGRDDVPRDVLLDPRLGTVAGAPELGSRGDGVAVGLTHCRLMQGPDLPADLARQTATAEAFLPSSDILWVRDPGSRISLPYTVTGRLAAATRRLLSVEGAAMSRGLAAQLAPGGVVITRRGAAERRLAWDRQLQVWRRGLRVDGFAVLRGLFPPLFLGALRTYYGDLDREGYLLGGDLRRAGYPLVHGEPVLQFLTGQLAPVVRRLTQDAVAPSFPPYLRIYEPGSVLERHRDQPVCRWNVDLVVGGDPAPTRSTSSTIWIAARHRVARVRLGLGDALLYRGTDVEHWRRPHPPGRTTAMASLHFGAPPSPRR